MTVSNEQLNKNSIFKTILIIVISFISLPLIILTIMYFSNEDFKDNANKVLSVLPGKAGVYFQSVPTKMEREDIKKDIAKHYITLDENRILDKLLIVKGENEQLYSDLVVLMSKENPNKMKKVKEQLKVLKIKEDPINRILDEIDKESEEKINSLQKYYTSLKLSQAIDEIERTYASNEISIDELVRLFQNLKAEQAAKYAFYLNDDIVKQIEYKLPKDVLRGIEKKKQELKSNQKKLLDLSLEYENKKIEETLMELGNTNQYNMEQLAVIFKGLSINKSARVLSKINDKDFMLTLFDEINHLQYLQKEEPSVSPSIMKGITVYKEYDNKINELSVIYDKTTVEELAKMLEIMLKRNETYQKHDLTEKEQITFTEEELVIDVLKKLKPTKVAEILEMMSENTRITLSKKLLK
ncbi:hypothetical protein [Alkaliphilus oremlandii]|uniref:Uncharacterized protein n=1 Tax=Alkaliphilus oremlandii (strain OhILAs) TaxID=350688 RepID=A8MHE1_ALKOO|nr:hypothetical protein [Alkaliphilus oremlandii]ABW19028.1 hypothetical protein Clos_1484 [Alkaliphilus oremlandii OhILAs]